MAQNGQLKCPKYQDKVGLNQLDLKMGLLKLGDPYDFRALKQIQTALGQDSAGERIDGEEEGNDDGFGGRQPTANGMEVIELQMKEEEEDDLDNPTIDQYPKAMLDTNSRKSHSSHRCDSEAEKLFKDLNLDRRVQTLIQEEGRYS